MTDRRERLHRALDWAMDSQSNDPWRRCAVCGQKTTRVLCPKCGERTKAEDGRTALAKDYQAEEFKVGERVKVWPAGGKKAWTGRVVKVGPGPELTIDNSAWNVPQRVPVSQVSKEQ
jgi:hypothetical protein